MDAVVHGLGQLGVNRGDAVVEVLELEADIGAGRALEPHLAAGGVVGDGGGHAPKGRASRLEYLAHLGLLARYPLAVLFEDVHRVDGEGFRGLVDELQLKVEVGVGAHGSPLVVCG